MTSPSNPDLSTDYWQTAANVCTTNELIVLYLRNERHLGTRRIALVLGVTRTAVRERLDNADRKLAAILKETA